MKYLISETTKEERLKIVYKALGISTADAPAPSKEAMNLVNEYIEGNMELSEVQKKIIEMHKKVTE